MAPEFVTIYTAYAELDQTEGRGGRIKIGHFYTEKGANLAAEGKGVMGSRGSVTAQSYLSLDGGINGYPVEPASLVNLKTLTRTGTLKTQALQKLTPEERKALGV